MTECLLICFSGGVLGVVLAAWAVRWLTTYCKELSRQHETICVEGEWRAGAYRDLLGLCAVGRRQNSRVVPGSATSGIQEPSTCARQGFLV